jgi:hypothetical protein
MYNNKDFHYKYINLIKRVNLLKIGMLLYFVIWVKNVYNFGIGLIIKYMRRIRQVWGLLFGDFFIGLKFLNIWNIFKYFIIWNWGRLNYHIWLY